MTFDQLAAHTILPSDEGVAPAFNVTIAKVDELDAASEMVLRGVVQDTPPDPATVDFWIDTSTTVAAGSAFRQDSLTATFTGPNEITLGGDPVPNSVQVFANGVLKASTVAARVVSVELTAADAVTVMYAYPVGAPTPSAATMTQLLVNDSFTRANSATSLGTSTSGHTWIAQAGTWGINTNQAYMATVASANDSAVIDCGKADAIVQVKIAAVGGSQGFTVRATDSSNAITSNLTGLFRRTAAANAQIATYSASFVVTDTMRVVMKGSSIKVYRQAGSTGAFTQVASVTETQGQTVTKHGFRQSGDTTALLRFDDFLIAG
jgi:hypothetical protein